MRFVTATLLTLALALVAYGQQPQPPATNVQVPGAQVNVKAAQPQVNVQTAPPVNVQLPSPQVNVQQNAPAVNILPPDQAQAFRAQLPAYQAQAFRAQLPAYQAPYAQQKSIYAPAAALVRTVTYSSYAPSVQATLLTYAPSVYQRTAVAYVPLSALPVPVYREVNRGLLFSRVTTVDSAGNVTKTKTKRFGY